MKNLINSYSRIRCRISEIFCLSQVWGLVQNSQSFHRRSLAVWLHVQKGQTLNAIYEVTLKRKIWCEIQMLKNACDFITRVQFSTSVSQTHEFLLWFCRRLPIRETEMKADQWKFSATTISEVRYRCYLSISNDSWKRAPIMSMMTYAFLYSRVSKSDMKKSGITIIEHRRRHTIFKIYKSG